MQNRSIWLAKAAPAASKNNPKSRFLTERRVAHDAYSKRRAHEHRKPDFFFNSAHTQVHAQQCQELKITQHWTNVQQDRAGGKGQALDMKLMLEKAGEQQLYTFTYETGN